jgi:hypothetical protein
MPTAHHIIDIEKTDADDELIEKLELVLSVAYETATIITDSTGSMYSIYGEFPTLPNYDTEQFAKGALAALEIFVPSNDKLFETLDNATALLNCIQSGTEVPPAVLANMIYEARAALEAAK